MENERPYIVKRQMIPTPNLPGSGKGPYYELSHYQTLDEAVIRLFKGNYAELFRTSAQREKLPYYVDGISIIDAATGNDLMKMQWVKAHMLPERAPHMEMHDRLYLEMGQMKDRLTTPLKELFSKFIHDFDNTTYIPIAMLFGGPRMTTAHHINLRLAVLDFAKPESPHLSNYGANLHIDLMSKGRYKISPGTHVHHKVPFSDFSYAIPRLLSVDLSAIGSKTEAKIMDWRDKTPVIALVARKNETDNRDNGLFLEFKSELWRLFVETSFPQLPSLCDDSTQLSIQIGSYGQTGNLYLTPQFSAFKDAVTSAIEIRRMNQSGRVAHPPFVDVRKGLRKG